MELYYRDQIKILNMKLEIVQKGFFEVVKNIAQRMGDADNVKRVELESKSISELYEAYNRLIEEIKNSLDEALHKLQELLEDKKP